MPTAYVKPEISDNGRRTRRRVDPWIPIGVLAALLAIVLIRPMVEPGPFIGRVTVVNNSEYAFDVDVSGAKADDWMALGAAAERHSTGVAEVFDQGGTWTFRFTTQGVVAGQVEVSRADLSAAGWQIVIPDRFAAALRADGVVPTSPIH
jgi:hypothetical protein